MGAVASTDSRDWVSFIRNRGQDQVVTHATKSSEGSGAYMSETARFVLDLLDGATRYRKPFSDSWQKYYTRYRGQSWRPADLPKQQRWKAYLTVNYSQAIVETIIAVLMGDRPKITFSANSPEQYPYVETIQCAVDQVWQQGKCFMGVLSAVKAACIYGTGYLKIYWDDAANDGLGGIRVDFVPTENIWVDPMAETFDRAEYVIEVKRVPLSYIHRNYPERGKFVRTGTAKEQASYAEQKTSSVFSRDPGGPATLVSTAYGTQPLINYGEAFGTATPGIGQSKEQWCDLYEVWYRDHSRITETLPIQVGIDPNSGQPQVIMHTGTRERYPNGRVFHYAGGVCLDDGPAPQLKWPYVKFTFNPLPGEFYGQGAMEILRDLQVELDKRRSDIVNHANLMSNAVWIIDRGSQVDPRKLTNEPGQIIEKNQGTECRRESPMQLPNWMLQAVDMAIRDMREVIGVPATASGTPPRGVRSGSGFEAAQSIANTRINLLGLLMKNSVEDMAAIFVALFQQKYTKPRMIRLVGSTGQPYWVPFDQHAARGMWDIEVEVDSMSAFLRAARAQQAIQLYQLQLLDKRAALEGVQWPDRERVLRRMGDASGMFPEEYDGNPGVPNRDRTDQSGYALSVRANAPGMSGPTPPGAAGAVPSAIPPVGGSPTQYPSQGGR